MGGDHGPAVTVPASLQVLAESPDLQLLLVGDESLILPYLDKAPATLRQRLFVRHTTEFVTMDDKVATALRVKKQSSMRLAVNAVRELRRLGSWRGRGLTWTLPEATEPGLVTVVIVQAPRGGRILSAASRRPST